MHVVRFLRSIPMLCHTLVTCLREALELNSGGLEAVVRHNNLLFLRLGERLLEVLHVLQPSLYGTYGRRGIGSGGAHKAVDIGLKMVYLVEEEDVFLDLASVPFKGGLLFKKTKCF
jgi:hypothetical protein